MPKQGELYLKYASVLFVCAAALLTARLAAQFVASSLWVPRARVDVADTKPAVQQKVGAESDYQVIATRNLFNDNPPQPGQPISDKPATPVEAQPPAIDFQLVATVVKTGDSFAVFTRGDQILIRRPGMEIGGGYSLSEVAATKVVVTAGKDKKEIALFDAKAEAGAKRPGSRTPLPSPAPTPMPASVSANENIKQVGPNSYAVDRKEVDTAMANLTNYMMQIRVIPNLVDGQHQGFRVANIVPGSIFMQIGLLNGDVLKEINGTPLNGFEVAYQLMQNLPTQSSLQIKLERNGVPMGLSYEIR